MWSEVTHKPNDLHKGEKKHYFLRNVLVLPGRTEKTVITELGMKRLIAALSEELTVAIFL